MLNYDRLNVFSHLESIFYRRDIHLQPKSVGKGDDSMHLHTSSCENGPQVKGTLPPQKESLKLPPIVTSSSQVSSEMSYNSTETIACIHFSTASIGYIK